MKLSLVMAEGAAPNLDVEREFLEGQDVEIRIAQLDTAEKVRRETSGVDGVIVALEPLPRDLIESLQSTVRIIGRAGIGLDAIDLDAARDRAVAVFHTPDYATEEVATHAIALMLALNRRIVEGNEIARSDWEAYEKLGRVTPLSEQVVGVVGLGRIGLAVVERLKPFGPKIVAFDPFVQTAPVDVSLLSSLDDVLVQADVLTLHLPLTVETTNFIGPREIGLLKPGAVLINVSRGRLVDETALTDALERGTIRAGLDVWNVEPPPPHARILSLQSAILTPHFAWYSDSSERRVRTEVLSGVIDYLRGQTPRTGRLVIDPRNITAAS